MVFRSKRKALLSLVIVLLLSACATTQNHNTSDELKVIDAHTHLSPIGYMKDKSDPEILDAYFKEWEAAGVVGGVVHTSDLNKRYVDLPADKNVIFCAGVREKIDYQALEKGLKSKKFNCVKIYLGYVKKWAYDSSYLPVYRLAEKYQVPVVYHTGDTYDPDGMVKFADPLTIDEVAVRFRKVNFVIAHCGNPWIQSAAEVAYKNENVYLEGSALLIGNMSELNQADVDEYVVKPLRWMFGYVEDPSKMMFGTDWPLSNINAYKEAFQRAIPKEHWNKVFYENAARVFGFKPIQDQKN